CVFAHIPSYRLLMPRSNCTMTMTEFDSSGRCSFRCTQISAQAHWRTECTAVVQESILLTPMVLALTIGHLSRRLRCSFEDHLVPRIAIHYLGRMICFPAMRVTASVKQINTLD
uniref:Uncharacterized protein n=1 Tax=Parascaris univalens TaxID=6257 RepID=A0A915B9S0_PARUN